MANVIDSKRLQRLETAIDIAMRNLSEHRQNRKKRLAAWLGKHYSSSGSDQRTPVNLLALASGIYLRQLAGGTPRIMVNTESAQLFPAADDLEQAGNVLLDQIQFVDSLRRLVTEALFGMGIMKVGLNKSGTVEIGGFYHDVGQPFADVVSLDNFVFDIAANQWEKVTFMGDFYRMPKEFLLESGLFNKKHAQQVHAIEKSYITEWGDETAEAFSGFDASIQEEYTDHVQLLDLWLPLENVYMTVTYGENNFRVLREVEWEGPEGGPYHHLSFQEVPDNIMPMPPAAHWYDLHRIANGLMNKLHDEAQSLKSLLVFQRGSEPDMQTVQEAQDGDAVGLDNPSGAQEVRFGGPDQLLLAYFIQVRDLFSWVAGNLDTLGGLSPMAETLGQEAILNENSSQIINDMRDRVIGFVRGVVKDLIWWMWTDPLIEIPIIKRIKGTDVSLKTTFTAHSREGSILDYNITIDPYSVRFKTPSGQLQKMGYITQTYALPLLPAMEAQGLTFNFEEFFSVLGEYADLPELKRFITYMTPEQQEAAMKRVISEGSQKPPNTTRNYTRTSQSTGGTRTGRDTAMMQHLLRGTQQ